MRASFPSLPRRVFASLASRISFFVFAATLASALTVAGTSALAVRSLLRSQVEERIPEAAARARDRLDLWLAQRALEVEVFSNADIVIDGVSRLVGGTSASHQRDDIEQYLSYVRAELPVYAAIVVLDAHGEELARVGEEHALRPALRQQIALATGESRSSVWFTRAGDAHHIVSAPIRLAGGERAASLHAVLPLAALREQLALAAREDGGRLHLFDPAGAHVASSVAAGVPFELAPELARAEAGAVEYTAADGVHVVASELPLERLGWRLVYEGDYGATFAPIASILTRTVGLNFGIVVVLTILAFTIARALLRPLHALSECAIRLRDGESNVTLPVVSTGDEVGILSRRFSEMVDSLTRANESLEQLAITDGLTRIHNHRFFQDRLSSAARRSDQTGEPLALVLLDIDDFKALNDRHGHACGDGVLKELAQILSVQARDDDVVARYGGEEFVVLAPRTELGAASALAEQIRLAIHDHEFTGAASEAPVRVTVSIGVSRYHGDRLQLFADADRALYTAKHEGKDCVVTSEDSPGPGRSGTPQ